MTDKWVKYQLKDCVAHKKGFAFKSNDFTKVGHAVVRVSNFTSNSIDLTECSYIDLGNTDIYNSFRLISGDVVIATVGSWPSNPASVVGKVVQVPNKAEGALLNQNAVILRTNKNLLEQRYLFYLLKEKNFSEYIVSTAQGSANQASITLKDILDFEFNCPSLNEQIEISNILGSLDQKIELNYTINNTIEQIVQRLFKSWFIDFDPVKAKAAGREPEGMDAETATLFPSEFEQSELGMIPKGWKVKQIIDIAKRISMGPFGSRITTDNFVEEGVPVIRGNNLKNGFYDNDFVYLTEKKANELKSSAIFSGDIVFTHRGTLGQVGSIPYKAKYPRYIVSQSQMLLSVDKLQVSPKIIYRFFLSPQGQQALFCNVNPTGVPAIARPTSALKAIQFVCPTKEVSDLFDKIAAQLDSRQENNNRETELLVTIRNSLLPRLISGQLRIPDVENTLGDLL